MRTVDEVLALYEDRRRRYLPLHQKMEEIRRIYTGQAEIPLPDLERTTQPAVPNLLAQGVDQMAGRIASLVPMVTFSSEQPGVRKYERRASNAQQVIQGWWQADRLPMKMKQRARHLIAYGMSPVVIRWDMRVDRPIWHVRSPLETYPSPDIIPGTVTPTDCLFAYRRSAGWLRDNGYAGQVTAVMGPDVQADWKCMVLEYVDIDGTMLLCTGVKEQATPVYSGMYGQPGVPGRMQAAVMEIVPNRADKVPVAIPTRIALDSAGGQFDTMVGMYYQQAKLMALETIAVEKGIFPDTYLISRPGETGRFLDGPHDGRTGKVNVVAGGDVRELQSSPGYLTNPTLDRLERAQRVTAGIPAEFGGESGSNIRTGRRGDAVLSAVIDYPVAEAQEAFAAALVEEDKAAIALSKANQGGKQRSLFVGTGNTTRSVTFVANDVFSQEEHVVAYPATGTDLNSLMIGLGQRVGLGIMSKETAARLDPFIDNPEVEHDRIITEGLEQALVAGIQQQAASGQIPPLVLAKVMTLVANDRMELAEALNKVTEDAAKEQAAQEATPTPEGQAMSPEAAMAPGAMQAMTGQSPVPGASPGQQDLAGLLSALRRPTQTVQPMRGVQRGAM